MTCYRWISRGVAVLSLFTIAACADRVGAPLARSEKSTASSSTTSIPGVYHGAKATFVVDTVRNELRGGSAPRSLTHSKAVGYFKYFTQLERFNDYIARIKKHPKIVAAKQSYDQGKRSRMVARVRRTSTTTVPAPNALKRQATAATNRAGPAASPIDGAVKTSMAMVDDPCTEIELAIYAATGDYEAARADLEDMLGPGGLPDEMGDALLEQQMAKVAELEAALNIWVVQWHAMGCDQPDPVPDYEDIWLGNSDTWYLDDGGGGMTPCYTEVWVVEKSFDGGNTWYVDSYFYIDRCG